MSQEKVFCSQVEVWRRRLQILQLNGIEGLDEVAVAFFASAEEGVTLISEEDIGIYKNKNLKARAAQLSLV